GSYGDVHGLSSREGGVGSQRYRAEPALRRFRHGILLGTRSGWSREARAQQAAVVYWEIAISRSLGRTTMCPSRTARSCERRGCPFTASRAPGQELTRITSGSATKARSAPGGVIPWTPISRPTLLAPAASMSAPMAVSAPAVISPDQ